MDMPPILGRAAGRRSRPLLVTGVPRSGTTWLARQLAGAPRCAMTGREPMNPHPGQYRLGGTLDAWARLEAPTRRQSVALRAAYAGLTPRVYGRYGHRQWAAASPFTRTVVKDPYAVLSIRTVVETTGAVPVLVYRHPAAVLSSYRRMGWRADVAEIRAAVPDQRGGAPGGDAGDPADDTHAMAWFWSTLNTVALQDLEAVPGAVVVSHEELAAGGAPALRRVFDACGLSWSDPPGPSGRDGGRSTASDAAQSSALHRLDRAPAEVAVAWRSGVSEDEVRMLEHLTGPALTALTAARLPVI